VLFMFIQNDEDFEFELDFHNYGECVIEQEGDGPTRVISFQVAEPSPEDGDFFWDVDPQTDEYLDPRVRQFVEDFEKKLKDIQLCQ